MEIGEKIEISKFNMNDLFEMAAKDEWDKVVDIYRKFPEAHKTKCSSSGDTAVHIAVSQQGKEEIVKHLVDQIRSPRGGGIVALEIKNNEGDTPLHVAVSKGNERMCECIAQAYPSLVVVGDAKCQTPIFLAVQDRKLYIFLTLLQAAEGDPSWKDGKDIAEESIRNVLFHMARKDKWDEVVNIYKWTPLAHKAKITALHIAVSEDNIERVEKLIKEISANGEEGKEALKVKNEQGNTALHVAASMGSVGMCQCIAQVDPLLVGVRNEDGETPFFLAALHGKKEAFFCLLGACESKDICEGYSWRNDGETILHVAVAGDYFDLAFQIIHLFGNLVDCVNQDGFTPLHLLAAKPSAFRSGSHFGRFHTIIYHCIFVDELKKEVSNHQSIVSRKNPNGAKAPSYPENYKTCMNFFGLVGKAVPVVLGLKGKNEARTSHPDLERQKTGHSVNINGENGAQTVPVKRDEGASRDRLYIFPPNYVTCFEFAYKLKALLVVLGQGSSQIKRIQEKKEKHTWSIQIMNELLQRVSSYEDVDTGTTPRPAADDETRPYTIAEEIETPLLIAAKNGITEIVEGILERFPIAVHDKNTEKKNVVLFAVEHRQPLVYQLLLNKSVQTQLGDSMFRVVDKEGNSALHLAAKLGEYKPWLIPGAALQMQWEIKWYQFVKKSKPPNFFPRYNKQGKTPENLFTKTHRELVEKGGEWLNKTSESCTVIAALIATVAFTTSAAVPGGVKQDTGIPTLEHQLAFNVFAISSLVALCFSVTAVVTFHVAILTSRYEERDFGIDFPTKLFVGLMSLFISIVSMLISFCAGHFFIIKDKLKYAAIPVYTVACLPVTFYAMVQFPLYFDLIWAIFREVPQRGYKAVPV